MKPPLRLSTRTSLVCLRFMDFQRARTSAREHLAEARACFKGPHRIAHSIGRVHLEAARDEARRARDAWEALSLDCFC